MRNMSVGNGYFRKPRDRIRKKRRLICCWMNSVIFPEESLNGRISNHSVTKERLLSKGQKNKMIDLLKGYNNANDFFGGLFQSVLVSLLTGIVIQIYKSIKSFVSKIREKQKRINIREMSAVDYDIVKKISDNSTWQAIEYCGICFIKYVIDICWIVVFIESIDKIYCLYGMGLSVKDNDRASVIIGVLCFTCCLYEIGSLESVIEAAALEIAFSMQQPRC